MPRAVAVACALLLAAAARAEDVPMFKRGHLRPGDPLVVVDRKGTLLAPGEPGFITYRSSVRRGRSVKDTFMYGSLNATFEYFVAVQIGSARQLFFVQADTGSSVLAVPGKQCVEYTQDGKYVDTHPHPRFSPPYPLVSS
jgi:Eukaryotic aspartyl protease